MSRVLRLLPLNEKVEFLLKTRKNDCSDRAWIKSSVSPSEKYSSVLSLRFAKGRTPTIAVRYCAGKFDASLGPRPPTSDPPGFQVQTFTGSAMFLKRHTP